MHRSIFLPLLMLSAVMLSAPGCASFPGVLESASVPPTSLGPGTIFPTVEQAVYDALARAHEIGAQKRVRTRLRGGTIRRVDGGFTYESVQIARRWSPNQVRYTMRPHDVAHFVVYPSVYDDARDESAESHSRRDRRNVDRRDPLHRPHYLLTPSMRVVVYEGEGRERQLGGLVDKLPASVALR